MTTQQTTQTLTTGTQVVDRDGFQGTIVKVTNWEGSTWFDVRFRSGVAVRYTSDLTVAPTEPVTVSTKDFGPSFKIRGRK